MRQRWSSFSILVLEPLRNLSNKRTRQTFPNNQLFVFELEAIHKDGRRSLVSWRGKSWTVSWPTTPTASAAFVVKDGVRGQAVEGLGRQVQVLRNTTRNVGQATSSYERMTIQGKICEGK